MHARCLVLSLVLGVIAQSAAAQGRTVTGRVTDAVSGGVVGSPSISVIGTAISTVGAVDGTFVLRNVPAGDVTLLVRRLGYRRREIQLPARQSEVEIALDPDALRLEDLVVTGQVTGIERRNVANAVATVEAEDLVRAPAATIERTLQGKVAGANIQANSGAPGGGVQVELRGITSLTGGSPLYVVDGVIVSDVAIPSNVDAITQASTGSNPSRFQGNQVNRITDLNPADIANVEILKGASASAIYGSKASNGVIVITTKRGRAGPAQVDVSQRFGAFDLARTLTRAWTGAAEVDSAYGPGTAAFFGFDQNRNRNWETDLAGHHPLSWQTGVSLSAGDEATRVFVSGLAKRDGGVMQNNYFEKDALRLNLDHAFGNRASLQLSTNLIRTGANRGISNNDNTGVSPWLAGFAVPRFVDLTRMPDGTFPVNPFGQSNPLQTMALLTNDEDVWRFIGSGRLDADLIRSPRHRLRFVGLVGMDRFTQQNTVYSPPEMQYEPTDGLLGTSALLDGTSEYLNGGANLIHEYHAPSGALTATTSAGLQYDSRDLQVSDVTTRNLLGDQTNIDQGSSVQVEQTRSLRKDFGVYLQEELLLHDRLLFTAGARADQSSGNTDNAQLFLYPKAAASYRWTLGTSLVDEIKFRAAYGQSGKQPEYGQRFTPLDGSVRIEGILGYQVEGSTASSVKPERQGEFELGTDVTMAGGRARLEATVYHRRITDLLLTRSLAPSSGFAREVFNGGAMRVNGLELALTMVPAQSADLAWVVRSTFGLNRSKITDLPVPAFVPQPGNAGYVFGPAFGAYFIEQGQSATQIVGNNPDAPGGFGKVGDSNPDFRAGLSSDLSWKAFDLFVLLDWQQGGDIINLTKLQYAFSNNFYDCTSDPNTNPCLQRVINFSSDTRGNIVEPATFLKVRELTISWSLPAQLTRSIWGRVRYARVVASARNWLTFTGYTGMDPEVSNFGSQAIGRNVDVAAYPRTRSVWFGFDLGF